MRTIIYVSAFFILAGLIFTGCSKAPETESANANTALENAKAAEAELYALESYQTAQDTLIAANAQKAEQDAKFGLLRSYGKSVALYNKAEELADLALNEAIENKEQAKKEVASLLTNASDQLDQVKAALETAPVGKGSKAELELMKSELSAISETYISAVRDFEAEKYLTAMAKLESVNSKAEALLNEVKNAKTKKLGI